MYKFKGEAGQSILFTRFGDTLVARVYKGPVYVCDLPNIPSDLKVDEQGAFLAEQLEKAGINLFIAERQDRMSFDILPGDFPSL